MDQEKFINLLKNLQNIMHCPSCNSTYSMDEMQFLGNQDGYFLLSMTCKKCSLPVWVNFFAGNREGSRMIANDLTVMDFDLMNREPISKNEVIDFHLSLKKFNGDFREAL